MPDKIFGAEFTDETNPSGSETISVNNGVILKDVTLSNAISAPINNATTKSTPVDADKVGIVDSAAGNILKGLTWANIKATLKTYFDTIYTLLIHDLTAKTTPVDADEMVLSDSAASFANKKITWANVKATLKAYFDTLYTELIHGLSAKTTPVDADEFVLSDSAASFADKKVTWANIKATLLAYFDTLYSSLSGTDKYNYLVNGGFPFASRQSPSQGTLTTYAANTYSADRWKTYAENASYQYARQDGLGETGLTSQYFGAFKKITSTGKMMIYQILEGNASASLRGKTVIFQCQMKASSAKTIRMGIFDLKTAGTIDSVPSPIVTAAGANSTDPTMGTNVAIITAAQSKSVTTSMQTFSVSVTVPATSKNIIVALWTDSQFSANDILYVAEAGLYVSATVQSWKPRLPGTELNLCQRFCYVTPDGSSAFGETGVWNSARDTSTVTCIITYTVDMRTAPSFSSSGNFRVDDGAAATAVTSISSTSISVQRAALFAGVAGTPLTQFRSYKLSANNDTTAKLIFDAEL